MITRKIKKTIYNALVICLLLIGLVYVCSRFIHPGVEYTDNAQVRQHITPVNTRVQGFIREIRFEEYSPVRRGDTLLLIEDAEFTRKCGGRVNFYITSHIQRHIVMGSVLVSYGKNRVRITPLCLNRLKRDMLNGLTKQLTTPLFRTYVIDGPTYRCIKSTSSSVLEWLRLYIGFVEATYVAHYNVLEQFHTTTRQLQVPATPKALTTLHPSYLSELGNRMGVEDAFGSVMPIDETLLKE